MEKSKKVTVVTRRLAHSPTISVELRKWSSKNQGRAIALQRFLITQLPMNSLYKGIFTFCNCMWEKITKGKSTNSVNEIDTSKASLLVLVEREFHITQPSLLPNGSSIEISPLVWREKSIKENWPSKWAWTKRAVPDCVGRNVFFANLLTQERQEWLITQEDIDVLAMFYGKDPIESP